MLEKNKLLIAIAVVLVAVGAGMTVYSMEKHMDDTMDSMDEELWESERALDDTAANLILRFDEDLEYTTTREDFLRAERICMETGRKKELLQAMNDSSLSNRNIFLAMVAMKSGDVFLTTDGKDYEIKDEIGEEKYLVENEDKEVYIALRYNVDEQLSYLGIIDTDRLYQICLSRMTGLNYEVIIADITDSVLRPDNREGTAVENLLKNNNKKELVSFEQEGAHGTQNIRQAINPAKKTKNGIFSISVYGDFNREITMFRKTAVNMIVFLLMVAAGIMLLIFMVIFARRREAVRDEEILQLKEKTKAMEELNRKTQELAHHQRLETIGTLTSSIAHEFNNLLTPIMGYSLMTLEHIPDTSPVYDDILEIYNASFKAKDIISRLSELSRKNTEMVFARINADALVNKVLNVAAPALPKNVDVHRNMNCNKEYIYGNEIQLSQLLLNLVINAYQAMESEGGVLTVRTEAVGNEIIVSVKDTGKGIPEEIQEKIFKPFFTTKDNGKGTGLGLAIAAQAVEDHGGRITVDSKPKEGTEFKVFLMKFNGNGNSKNEKHGKL